MIYNQAFNILNSILIFSSCLSHISIPKMNTFVGGGIFFFSLYAGFLL